MRTIFAILKKELTSHLTTLWAWVVFTVMALLISIFFLQSIGMFSEVQDAARTEAGGWSALPQDLQMYRNLTDGVILPLWNVVLVVTLFVAPFLSMRLFAEERSKKTLELLLTVPIRPLEIVLGKYLGGLLVFILTLSVTLVFPVILSLIGSSESGSALEWRTVGLGYLSMLLWGGALVAIGMFVSSMTESQMVAAFVTFAIGLGWMILPSLGSKLGEPLRSALDYLAVDRQLQYLVKGVLDLKPIVFFSSVIAFFVLLTHRSVEAQRWT